MIKDRNVPTSVKFPNSLLSKIDENVKKFHLKDNSTFIRESAQVMIDFLNCKENYLKTSENALEFLKKIEPQFTSQKTQDSILKVYAGLSDKEQEMIFYSLDLKRKEKIQSKKDIEKMEKIAVEYGYEVEAKVGYIPKGGINNMRFWRPISPDDSEWDEMTNVQKECLLEEQKNKLAQNQSNELGTTSGTSMIMRNIKEISTGLEQELNVENKEQFFSKE